MRLISIGCALRARGWAPLPGSAQETWEFPAPKLDDPWVFSSLLKHFDLSNQRNFKFWTFEQAVEGNIHLLAGLGHYWSFQRSRGTGKMWYRAHFPKGTFLHVDTAKLITRVQPALWQISAGCFAGATQKNGFLHNFCTIMLKFPEQSRISKSGVLNTHIHQNIHNIKS